VSVTAVPLVLVGSVSVAIGHLDRLGCALAEVGLTTQPRYREAVPLLYAFHVTLPRVGESVRALPAIHGGKSPGWWFIDSMSEPIAPCSDMAGAVERVLTIFAPVLAAVGKSSLSQADGARLGERPVAWVSVPRGDL
jgi:hypothetical protein